MDSLLIALLIIVSLAVGWYSTRGYKSQWVRLGDVIFFGPFLIWLGLREEVLWIKLVLIILGTTTLAYNLRNFIAQSKENT
uniref:Uncharacterized protein n=1 Tax=Marseillevirus LCMAC101 TaxID=2506602 RepID=A0A481YSU0_9VIRU|nr:MAG: hypothetical protein LCMAC101_07340 [Marseillevirus LCMAC101]